MKYVDPGEEKHPLQYINISKFDLDFDKIYNTLYNISTIISTFLRVARIIAQLDQRTYAQFKHTE